MRPRRWEVCRAAGRFAFVVISGLLLGASSAQAPKHAVLDEAGGVGGLRFGVRIEQIAGFERQFAGVGKRWKTTRLCGRPGDTTTLAGMRVPLTYWFRSGRFIGVDGQLKTAADYDELLRRLSSRYGPPRADTVAEHWYWLGQRSWILLGKNDSHTGIVFAASLDMLNEQIMESAVRARARRELNWYPDSAGLPRQFPVR